MSDPYVYKGTNVLKNKFGITNGLYLDDLERFYVAQREAEGVPKGKFDLSHLKSIHHHLFQDVYDWAGDIRTVSMSKGGSVFLFPSRIESGVAHVHGKLEQRDFLQGLSADDFAADAAELIGDINYGIVCGRGRSATLRVLRGV